LAEKFPADKCSLQALDNDRVDRSVAVRLSPNSPHGFITHSFAGDNRRMCRDYVIERLGLPGFKPHSAAMLSLQTDRAPAVPIETGNLIRARQIWRESVDVRNTIAEI
jgi:hypothetical protein